MKRLLLGLVLLTLAVPVAYAQPADTVRVVAVGGDATCSATVIAPDIALTARHCLRRGMSVDGKEVAYITANGPENAGDIAIAVAPGLQCPCASLGVTPAVGDTIVAIGFPDELEGKRRVSDPVKVKFIGEFRALAPWFVNDTSVLIFSEKPIITYGDSGGGLFALQDGAWKLVGVNVLGVPERRQIHPFEEVPENASGFVPVSAASKFLPKL